MVPLQTGLALSITEMEMLALPLPHISFFVEAYLVPVENVKISHEATLLSFSSFLYYKVFIMTFMPYSKAMRGSPACFLYIGLVRGLKKGNALSEPVPKQWLHSSSESLPFTTLA